MIKVIDYIRDNGRSPFATWVSTLDTQSAAKVFTAIERMEQGNLGDYKSVGEGVWERRLDFGPGYRIYFGRDGLRVVVLVGGGTKSRQSADIRQAKAIWAEYKANKK